MDSITQATFEAKIGRTLLGKKIGKKAAVRRAIGSPIPNLDVVLLPLYDSLQRINIHKKYSNSILFSVLGTLILAIVRSRIKWTNQISINEMFHMWNGTKMR